MKRLLLMVGLILLVTASTVMGFDGNRKGFVIGGGLGFAPTAGWDVNDTLFQIFPLKASESKAGAAVNVFIGYAWDEKNMIVYELSGAGYSSDKLNQNLSQGFNGPTWYHYYGDKGRSAFTTVGLGLYTFDGENFDPFDPGPGVLLGIGYEFTPHFQFGLYGGFGTISELGVDLKLHSIAVLVNAVAF